VSFFGCIEAPFGLFVLLKIRWLTTKTAKEAQSTRRTLTLEIRWLTIGVKKEA
jgi:hypothetical protein